MNSPFASWMDRFCFEEPDINLRRDEETEEQRLLKAAGCKHESTYVKGLDRKICEIDRSDFDTALSQTQKAISDRKEVIYQATLKSDRFSGIADLLILGENDTYEIWDIKLSRDSKPHHLIQILCYVDMLEAMTRKRSEKIGIILGDGRKQNFNTGCFFNYYENLKNSFLDFMDRFQVDAPTPFPDPRKNQGQWNSEAKSRLIERDHLIGVAGMTLESAFRFEEAGIQTIADLAEREPMAIPGSCNETFLRLKEQAKIQIRSRELREPCYSVIPSSGQERQGLGLLPPESESECYLSIQIGVGSMNESEAVIGLTHSAEGESHYREWNSRDESYKGEAFVGFVDYLSAKWKETPNFYVYHFGEQACMDIHRLASEYALGEQKIRKLFQSSVFVDLQRIFKQGVRSGVGGYSLEDIQKLFKREDFSQPGIFVPIETSEDWNFSNIEKARHRAKAEGEFLRDLSTWLRKLQLEHGLSYVHPEPSPEKSEQSKERSARRKERYRLADDLLTTLPPEAERKSLTSGELEEIKIAEILGHVLKFHRRELDPEMTSFDRRGEMTNEERFYDDGCLSHLQRTASPVETLKKSKLLRFHFDPGQKSKIRIGDRATWAERPEVTFTVEELDGRNGEISLKISENKYEEHNLNNLPSEGAIILREKYISTDVIEERIELCAKDWIREKNLSRLLRQIILREPPVIDGLQQGSPLVTIGETPLDSALRIAPGLRDSILLIQGPPGCGKTYTGGHLISELLKQGHNIGVASNSHKAITNLLLEANKIMGGTLTGAYKPKGNASDPIFGEQIAHLKRFNKKYTGGLLAGTSFLFSDPSLEGALDFLIIDEAGQVSLADLVAMTRCTTNMILIGDQMQLSHPTRGIHPGESGASAFSYLLDKFNVVPNDRGIFLSTTRRMHPVICDFISSTFYKGLLQADERNQNQQVWIDGEPLAGITFHPVPHTGNRRSSDEEAEEIVRVTRKLLEGNFTDCDRSTRNLELEDILFIAPYNRQVDKLREALPEGARVGSVDLFQGQQAPVVMLSLGSSADELKGRGVGFILDSNRVNVAISRAQALSVVVGDPNLAHAKADTIEDMQSLNQLCRMIRDSPSHYFLE